MNTSRMPGMGDLPGDSSHPNSPDFDHIAHDEQIETLVEQYADKLIEDGEVGALIEELRCCADKIIARCDPPGKVGERDYDMVVLIDRLRDITSSCNP